MDGGWAGVLQGLRHTTHFCLDESLAAIRLYKPRRTYLTGLVHSVCLLYACLYVLPLGLNMNTQFNYTDHNEQIRSTMAAEGLNVQMAFDGLVLDNIALGTIS